MYYETKSEACKAALQRYKGDTFHTDVVLSDIQSLEDIPYGSICRLDVKLPKYENYYPYICPISTDSNYIYVVPVFPNWYRELASRGDISTKQFPYYLEAWNRYKISINIVSKTILFSKVLSNTVDKDIITYKSLSKKELKRVIEEADKDHIVNNSYVEEFRKAETAIVQQILAILTSM